MPVLCPGCLWPGRALREERRCSLPGKTWGEGGAAALQGANYGFEAPGCSLAASARAAAGLLRSQPAAGLPAGWCTTPAELSSVPGRKADGARGCRSHFPPAARTALESIPAALGCAGSQGQGGEAQTSISSLASFFFIHRSPSWLEGGYFDRQKKGTSGSNSTPTPLPPLSTLPSGVFVTWQSKHL